MRTTLTLDDDVAAALEQLRKTRKVTFKQVVNEALREGLKQIRTHPRRKKPFRTRTLNLGPSLVGSLDNIAEVLSIIEGDAHK